MGGFDDLEEAVADEDESNTDDNSEDIMDSVDVSEPNAIEEVENTTTDDDENESDTSLESPAFGFDATSQKQMYVRPEVWSDWEDLRRFEIERELAERGIRNIEGRELDEAAIKVLLEHPDKVADYVEAARRDE